jgi:hypothetical protein
VSWDAYLKTAPARDCPHCGGKLEQSEQYLGDWNYTHNTNGMIAAAYEAVSGEQTPECGGPLGKVIGAAWWDKLDGASGQDGRTYLEQIIKGLEAEPERFRSMDPDNGWGSYDTLLPVLREMRDAVPPEPTVWRVSG